MALDVPSDAMMTDFARARDDNNEEVSDPARRTAQLARASSLNNLLVFAQMRSPPTTFRRICWCHFLSCWLSSTWSSNSFCHLGCPINVGRKINIPVFWGTRRRWIKVRAVGYPFKSQPTSPRDEQYTASYYSGNNWGTKCNTRTYEDLHHMLNTKQASQMGVVSQGSLGIPYELLAKNGTPCSSSKATLWKVKCR